MDVTLIATYKAEEKELNDKLFKKLEGLMLMYPPTDEFQKCFTNEMFLKTNQQAFYHTLHYLFRLLDPAEFKRRFYWPLIDKRAEANFRTSTVEYLKHLSEKNHLNWDIKSYLVVMPGGMKFITFLLDLVAFVIQEQIRQREKHLGIEIQEKTSALNVERMMKQNEFFKDYASHYINQVEKQIENLHTKTKAIRVILNGLNMKFPLNKKSLNELQESNKKLYEKNITTQSENIAALTAPFCDLKVAIEKLQNRATEQRKDRSGVNHALQEIFEGAEASILKKATEDTTVNPLIAAFTVTYPVMENFLQQVIQNNSASNYNVTRELTGLKEELEQILTQLVDFHSKYNPISKSKSKDAPCSIFQNSSILSLKFVSTPPIKLLAAENSNARLPLQDEKSVFDRSGNVLALPGAIPKTIKEHSRDHSSSMNSTINRSKIYDPVQLLRSIYKGSAKRSRIQVHSQQHRSNLSLLGSKCKDRQQMTCGVEKNLITPIRPGYTCQPHSLFNKNERHHQIDAAKFLLTTAYDGQVNRSIKNEQTSTPTGKNEVEQQQQAGFVGSHSPRTPFNTSVGEITRIAYTEATEQSPSALFKKSSIIKKVKDASLNIRNISTSPSGRLEALVSLEQYETMILANVAESKVPRNQEDIDSENNPNLLNMPVKLKLNLSGLNDDSIFDTSDTVLNDIY